jgi:hypothetical protein
VGIVTTVGVFVVQVKVNNPSVTSAPQLAALPAVLLPTLVTLGIVIFVLPVTLGIETPVTEGFFTVVVTILLVVTAPPLTAKVVSAPKTESLVGAFKPVITGVVPLAPIVVPEAVALILVVVGVTVVVKVAPAPRARSVVSSPLVTVAFTYLEEASILGTITLPLTVDAALVPVTVTLWVWSAAA